MSNKTLIPLIIVLSLITIGVASLTQLNKSPAKVAMNTSQNSEIISSVKTQVGSGSSQNVSKVTETSNVSSPQAEQTKSEVVITPKPETVDGSKVTYIDRNNPPQYIKDYLACEEKILKLNLPYIQFITVSGTKIEIQCPPDVIKKCDGIKVIIFNFQNKKWECQGPQGSPFECDVQLNSIFYTEDNSEINKELKQKYIKARSIGDDCLIFVNSSLTNQEIELFQNEIPNSKLIIYNNTKS
jgi:hypothetical protein